MAFETPSKVQPYMNSVYGALMSRLGELELMKHKIELEAAHIRSKCDMLNELVSPLKNIENEIRKEDKHE